MIDAKLDQEEKKVQRNVKGRVPEALQDDIENEYTENDINQQLRLERLREKRRVDTSDAGNIEDD
jgi:DNA replication licensing factor MCM2